MSGLMTPEIFKEGLSRLARNLSSIDYHRSGMQYALRVTGKDLSHEERSQLPELRQWRAFTSDIIAELRAAFEIGGRSFNSPLPHCCRLAVAMENGQLKSYGSPLIVEAITEIEITLLSLPATGGNGAVAPEMRAVIKEKTYTDFAIATWFGFKGKDRKRNITRWRAEHEFPGVNPTFKEVATWAATNEWAINNNRRIVKPPPEDKTEDN